MYPRSNRFGAYVFIPVFIVLVALPHRNPRPQVANLARAARPVTTTTLPRPTTTVPPTTTTGVTAAPSTTEPQPRPRPVVTTPPTTTPPPPPEPKPVDVSGCTRRGSKSAGEAHACWDGLLARYSWDTAKAFRIMMCESEGDPWNVGPPTRYGTAKGLMQVLPDGSFDPETNMAQAWKKYEDAGHSWRPWECQ